MTLEQIRSKFSLENDLVAARWQLLELFSESSEGNELEVYSSHTAKTVNDFNQNYLECQRSLNRQKKLLSLYRKKLLSSK